MDYLKLPPAGHWESTPEWARLQRKAGVPGIFVQPFDFGDEAYLAAPKTIENRIHPYLTPYSKKLPAGFVAVIPHGRVWGANGAVLTPEGMLLSDVSQEYDETLHAMVGGERHPIFRQQAEADPIHVKGTAVALAFCGSYNYFHWLYDVIARWEMLAESGISYDYAILNPNPYGPFVEQTLQGLGVPEKKILRTQPGLCLEADRLIVPSLILSSHYPAWATEALRKRFLPNGSPTPEHVGRLYISRQNASARSVVNEAEVAEFLEGFGFRSVVLERLPVDKQIALFASSKVIVAPHGAGLTNLAFCEPGTKVIEAFHPEHVMPTYWMISNHRKLDYYMMYGQRQTAEKDGFAGLEDMAIGLDTLERTLRLAGID